MGSLRSFDCLMDRVDGDIFRLDISLSIIVKRRSKKKEEEEEEEGRR